MTKRPCPFSRPIPFSPAMIRALLDGRKTQTRRALHLPAVKWLLLDPALGSFLVRSDGAAPTERRFLWVREQWATDTNLNTVKPRDMPDAAPIWYCDGGTMNVAPFSVRSSKLRPPMFLRRPHSRLTLEVELVRVERLQEITEADAIAEGIAPNPVQEGTWIDYPERTSAAGWADPRDSFRSLWTSINGPESWAANPKVCAITFTVHHQNIDALLIERGLKEVVDA